MESKSLGTEQSRFFECLVESDRNAKLNGFTVQNNLPDFIRRWNNTKQPYSHTLCIHNLFEMEAEKSPDAIALVFGGESVTYKNLNETANQLAHFLIQAGIGPDSTVGVLLERSIDLVVALLGILKAGGAYVPLDPDYPDSRLKLMARSAKLGLVLTKSQFKEKKINFDANFLCLDELNISNHVAKYPRSNPILTSNAPSPSNLAYVLFTSGSTGEPKGVMVEHRALVNRIEWMKRKYGCSPSDSVLQKTPFSFDVSIWEFFLPLISGARLVVAKPGGHRDPVYLFNLIQSESITKLHFVPSMLNAMLVAVKLAECRSLRQVFCSGEALMPAHVGCFFSQGIEAELHNLYGPTEAAIDVSHWACSMADATLSTIPIGVPIDNIQLFILDDKHRPVAIGELGELYIGGDGLARGYLNSADLTAEKFIPNPLAFGSCDRLYKTGDLCRYREDGNIEFYGRIDHQVKIRGHRVELGEIENLLIKHDHVNDAVVVNKDAAGGNQLIAFLTCQCLIKESDLREYLSTQLPSYMIPSEFVVLPELPLTISGKIDRKSLQLLESTQPDNPSPTTTALTFLQSAVYDVWKRALGYDDFGIDDDLFKIGGDSISAIQIFSAINNEFGVDIYMEELFSNNHFSVRWLATLIENYQIKSLGQEEYSALLESIEGLSEEQVQNLLSQ